MNTRMKTTLAATLGAMIALTYAGDSPETIDLSQIELPANSCAITCPTGTRWRGDPAAGASATCRAGSTPVCQCQDDSRPIAGCEALKSAP